MKRLAILGAGGHAGVLVDIAEQTGWTTIDVFDDAATGFSVEVGQQIVGTTADLVGSLANYEGVIIGIGNNQVRERLQRMLEAQGANLVNLIHPSATISRSAKVGHGCALLAGCFLINNARIGDGVIVNTSTSVDHDVQVGDFSHLSSGVFTGGGSKIGTRSFIGLGSCTRQLSVIGDDVVVGAGSVVIGDVASGLTVAGNPARPLNKNRKSTK